MDLIKIQCKCGYEKGYYIRIDDRQNLVICCRCHEQTFFTDLSCIEKEYAFGICRKPRGCVKCNVDLMLAYPFHGSGSLYRCVSCGHGLLYTSNPGFKFIMADIKTISYIESVLC